ncbi:MAG: ABC transporter ATP-binding protein [Thermaceae bacterium]|nr:ABC transporter ATP-binding protein [Thermaceae bacterium]
MSGIRVENIEKLFGKAKVLTGVSLEIRDQEFVVLLGPSGCGKTTLLRIIAGLEYADKGQVWIGDREVSTLPPRSRKIAMVFQNYAIFPHLTVLENIAFGLRMQKASAERVKAQVDRAATLMHIENLLQRYPAQLSGGQRQRVAVGRALAVEPEVLLMDEPLSNLDALLRLEMRAELKRLLAESRTTTLYVTHDQVEAMSLADRIAVMNVGQLVQYDEPIRVYQEPTNTFVGGFIGSPPMNFLRLRVEGGQARIESLMLSLPTSPPGQEVLLGVRPEDLEAYSQQQPQSFPAEVRVVEPLGPHLLLTLTYEQQSLKATVPPDFNISPGQTLWLKPQPGRLCWLDPTSGQALSR